MRNFILKCAVIFAAIIAASITIPNYALASGYGYHNMQTLDRSLKTKLNQVYARKGFTTRITHVVCLPETYTLAFCAVHYTNGMHLGLKVSISRDGSRWLTH